MRVAYFFSINEHTCFVYHTNKKEQFRKHLLNKNRTTQPLNLTTPGTTEYQPRCQETRKKWRRRNRGKRFQRNLQRGKAHAEHHTNCHKNNRQARSGLASNTEEEIQAVPVFWFLENYSCTVKLTTNGDCDILPCCFRNVTGSDWGKNRMVGWCKKCTITPWATKQTALRCEQLCVHINVGFSELVDNVGNAKPATNVRTAKDSCWKAKACCQRPNRYITCLQYSKHGCVSAAPAPQYYASAAFAATLAAASAAAARATTAVLWAFHSFVHKCFSGCSVKMASTSNVEADRRVLAVEIPIT